MMDACVRLLRTGFEQIVKLSLAPEQLLNRKHDVFSGTRPHSLLQCQNCVRALPHQGKTQPNRRCFPVSLCGRLQKHFSQGSLNKPIERKIMATKDKSTESVYRVTEVIGTSTQSWEDAAKAAVQTAAGTLRDLRIAEVVKMDLKIEDGKVIEYRTRLQLSFKYEG